MKQGVCHTVCGLAIYIKKSILRQHEEELWKLKYFTIAKILSSKNSLKKKTKILQDIITL